MKYPERKEITSKTGKLDTEYCHGWNDCREDFIYILEQSSSSLAEDIRMINKNYPFEGWDEFENKLIKLGWIKNDL